MAQYVQLTGLRILLYTSGKLRNGNGDTEGATTTLASWLQTMRMAGARVYAPRMKP
jgi:hypothetical protein